MEWTITLHKEDRYCEVVTRGVADKDGSLNMAKAVLLASGKEKIEKVLIDHRNISAVSGGILEVYNRPKELKAAGMEPGVMVAEIVKPEHRKFFDFLETVCVNRGFLFSVFENKKEGLDWLLENK